jgi:formate hydrogenlyase subunit 3/multisubunit Na+/H+ antiporter MnhD subunit
MLNHGISTGALFMLAGMLYERKHTYDFIEYGGLATPMPVYATFFLVIVLSSVGLPLMNGFVGEFLVLSGAFQDKAIYGILGASGVIWGAWYLLWMYQRVFYGPISHDENRTVPDIDRREQFALWPLTVMALIMGVASPYWMRSIDPSVAATIPRASTKAEEQQPQRTQRITKVLNTSLQCSSNPLCSSVPSVVQAVPTEDRQPLMTQKITKVLNTNPPCSSNPSCSFVSFVVQPFADKDKP